MMGTWPRAPLFRCLCCQPSTCSCIYILLNHWIATKKIGNYGLKNCQMHSKPHHLYAVCSKCPPIARTKILDVDEQKWRINKRMQIESHCWWHGEMSTSSARQTFWLYDVKMTWLTTRLTIFETITASCVRSCSVVHQNVCIRSTLCPKKCLHFYFLNNSVKNEPILIIFGTLNPEGTWH